MSSQGSPGDLVSSLLATPQNLEVEPNRSISAQSIPNPIDQDQDLVKDRTVMVTQLATQVSPGGLVLSESNQENSGAGTPQNPFSSLSIPTTIDVVQSNEKESQDGKSEKNNESNVVVIATPGDLQEKAGDSATKSPTAEIPVIEKTTVGNTPHHIGVDSGEQTEEKDENNEVEKEDEQSRKEEKPSLKETDVITPLLPLPSPSLFDEARTLDIPNVRAIGFSVAFGFVCFVAGLLCLKPPLILSEVPCQI